MDGESVTIRLDTQIYSIDIAQRAAFKCTDLASFEFSLVPEHQLVVTVTVKSGIAIDAEQLRARYNNELLDQKLRQTVAEETKNERDLILAYAFSNTKLLGT